MVIQANQIFNAKMIVEPKHTAQEYGSGLLAVFATPAMIAFIENTAHEALTRFLDTNQTSVGTEINVKHLKATLIGKEVHCCVKIMTVDAKKIEFSAEVFENNILIGSGTHIRYIVDSKKFMEKLNSLPQ